MGEFGVLGMRRDFEFGCVARGRAGSPGLSESGVPLDWDEGGEDINFT